MQFQRKKTPRYDGLLHTRVMHHVHQASAPASPARVAYPGVTGVSGASGIPRRGWQIGCISATGRQACLGPTGVAGVSGATCRLARPMYRREWCAPARLAHWRTRRVIAPHAIVPASHCHLLRLSCPVQPYPRPAVSILIQPYPAQQAGCRAVSGGVTGGPAQTVLRTMAERWLKDGPKITRRSRGR